MGMLALVVQLSVAGLYASTVERMLLPSNPPKTPIRPSGPGDLQGHRVVVEHHLALVVQELVVGLYASTVEKGVRPTDVPPMA